MALERLFDRTGADFEPEALYRAPDFPEPPPDRPYVFCNMVATADGKTLLTPRSTARGLGGPTDQLLMKRLQEAAEGIIIGAGVVRAGPVNYPPQAWRAVITASGNVALDNRFFSDAPGKAIIFAPDILPEQTRNQLGTRAQVRIVGDTRVDVAEALGVLRSEFGVRYLLLEGGANVNYSFIDAGVMDELFLTLAPKLKGGDTLPTVVDGPGLPNRQFLPLELISLYRDDDELYLRYRIDGTRREA